MITVNKANPTPGEITSSLTGSTGDGAGLHLEDGGQVTWSTPTAADFGTSDFSVEFILNQTEENTNGNYIYFSHTSGNNRLYLLNDKSANNIAVQFYNSSGSTTDLGFTLPYDMSADYGTPTHYVFTFDRDGDVTLYKNGNSVASVSISAASAINLGDSNTNVGRFGSSSSYGVLGTFYRFRTWNKLVDAKALFERSDVDYADQYGSETKLNSSTCVNATSSNAFNTFSGASATGFTAVSTGAGSSSQFAATADEISFVKGKKYSITFDATLNSGTAPKWNAAISILSATETTDHSIATVTAGANGGIFTANQTTTGVISFKSEGGAATNFAISNLKVVRCGVVVDMDLAFASPTQSLTVQDRAGSAHGTCSSSGVSHVQPVVQLNTEQLSVGGTNAKVGIGLAAGSNPQEMLHIDGISPRIRLRDSDAAGTPISTIDASGGDVLISADANDETTGSDIRLATDGTTRLTIDSSGNVTQKGAVLKVERDDNAPSLDLYNNKSAPTANTALGYYSFKGKAPSGAYSSFANIGGFVESVSSGNNVSGYLTFNTTDDGTGTVERMRIDSTGNALFNTTVTNPGNGNTNTGATILATGRMHLSTASSDHTVNRNSDGNAFEFRRSNAAVGSIAVTTSATAFNTSSDYRLKENLEPLTGALDRLDQLPVYRFNFKANPDTTVDGFVAHEVQAHVPEAVTGEKDAMKTVIVQEAVEAQPATYYEEGDELPEGKAVGDEKTPAVEAVAEVTEEQIDPQGIDQSKLVPLLVAAVKELKAKVENLENA